MDVVRLAVQRLANDHLLDSSLTIVWHAGEPLVLPPSYYEEAFDTVNRALEVGCEVTHSIQTNGTLIADAWCDLFKRHRVRVGVSVDGPRELHDRHRLTRDGKGTHHQVIAGMELLRKHDIPFHAIAVVTRDSLGRALEMSDFFLEQGVSEVGLNFDEAEGVNASSSLQGMEQAHRSFLAQMLERSIETNGRLRVREFANALRVIACDPAPSTYDMQIFPDNAQVLPFAIVTVACNGDFSTFSPELVGQQNADYSSFVLGNVSSTGYFEAATTEAFGRLWRDIRKGISACESQCAHFKYCGGGAPVNKLYENGTLASAETLYCRSMLKRPFDLVLGAIEKGQL